MNARPAFTVRARLSGAQPGFRRPDWPSNKCPLELDGPEGQWTLKVLLFDIVNELQ